MGAYNKTLRIEVAFKEGADHNPITTVTNRTTGAVVDISGYTFTLNILSEEGGDILDSGAVDFVTDGTDGQYQEVFTEAQLAALIAAGTFPTWFEFFAVVGGITKKWYHGPIDLERAGTA